MKWPLLLLCAVVTLLAACNSKKSDALVVGMELNFPPFETIDNAGRPAGMSVDLAEDLGRALGRPVRIENIPFVGLIPALKASRIDLILSSMTDTPQRRESIAFSDPYFNIGLALLVGKNSAIQSIADLDQPGRTLAVRQGTTSETWARAHLRQARILAIEKESAAVLEVLQGRADAFMYDQISIWQNWKRHTDETRALLDPVERQPLAIGLRKDDTKLREQVNTFLKDYRAAGGFEKLGDKYLEEQKAAFKERGIPFYF
ncbi:MAG TPA: transporter substrate-binding domain-containing protein [Chthoniobacterales bacterium]|nr:transporter substrate-binding domain-containing protein [Chthoniobacterales bacterium]